MNPTKDGEGDHPAWSLLHAAIEAGNVAGVHEAVRQGAFSSGPFAPAWFPPIVSWAMDRFPEGVDVQVVGFLLEKGARPDDCNDHYENPLLKAANRAREDLVDLLLKHGASLTRCQDRGDWLPGELRRKLHAIDPWNLTLEKKAAQAQRDAGLPPTLWDRQHTLAWKLYDLLERGHRMKALTDLMQKGCVQAALDALDHSFVTPDDRDLDGHTLLEAAAYWGVPAAVEPLLKRGGVAHAGILADAAEDPDSTALIEKFLDHGVATGNPRILDAALLRALGRHETPPVLLEMVGLLLRHGADPDCAVWGGKTLLMLAVEMDDNSELTQEQCHALRLGALRLLLDAGADARAVDRQGLTAVDRARNKGREPLAAFLESHQLHATLPVSVGSKPAGRF